MDKTPYEVEIEKEENSTHPEIYQDITNTNTLYRDIQEILNILIDSTNKIELLSKILLLCNILQKESLGSERAITILLLRLKGKTLPEIAKIVEICPEQVSKLLKKVENDKLLKVFAIASKINHSLYSGAKIKRRKYE